MTNIITKADINKLLKDKFEYGFIKYQVARYPFAKYKKVSDNAKGILLYRSSPIDCTSAKYERGERILREIVDALIDLGASVENYHKVKVNVGTKKEFEFYLDQVHYPAYAINLDMDPGYVNHFITVNFLEGKK
jgi:TATA-box binding protein (TBP) (component of TFIID and TFIIIB)